MLLGRQSEITAVGRALAAARAGESSALLLRGEPGIGKTTLLGHAVRSADSMRVLFARGVPFESDVPFAGLHALLLPAVGSIHRLTPVQAAGLRGALGLGERVGADPLVVGAATLSLISAYAEEGAVLIAIDDGHLLDRASAEAIAFAVRRLLADPVAVVVAVREGESSPLLKAGLPELRLGGLDRASGLALLEPGAGGPVPAETADRILRATGGNPLALVELADDAQSLPATSDHVPLPIRTTVERTYLRRAEGLSPGARLTLLLVAASPTASWELVRRAAAELSVPAEPMDEAAAAEGLVKPRQGRLEFRHPLARAAVYHAAPAPERRAAHRVLHGVMTEPHQADLLEVVEDRAQLRSTIVTSQLPVAHWHEVLGDPTIADATLDRLVNNAHRIQLRGDSLRRSRDRPAELVDRARTSAQPETGPATASPVTKPGPE